MDSFKPLVALNEILNENTEDSLMLDFSFMSDPVPLPPSPLPPYILGTHVKKGEWSDTVDPKTPNSDKTLKGDSFTSPGSEGEIIPSSPIISSVTRMGRRKHLKGQRRKKVSPQITQEESSCDGSFWNSPEKDESIDIPALRMASSLGCNMEISGWVSTMETPTNPSKKQKLVDKNGEMHSIDKVDKGVAPLLLSSETVACTKKGNDTARTLFSKEIELGMSQVVTVSKKDLEIIASDSDGEDDVSNYAKFHIIREEEARDKQPSTVNRVEDIKDNKHLEEPINQINKQQNSNWSPKDMAGFSTAAGDIIPVSEKALIEVRNKVNNHPSPCMTKEENVPVVVGGFTTAGGKVINISEEALEKARDKINSTTFKVSRDPGLKESLRTCNNSKIGEGVFNGGFSTAAGKKIEVSDKALRLARKRMDDHNKNSVQGGQEISNVSVGFSTASATKISEFENALKVSKMNILGHDSPNVCNDEKLGKGVFHGGFCTAGGKKIDVSDEALQSVRTRMKMDDLSKSSVLDKANSNVKVGFSTASGMKITVSDKALEVSKRNMSRMLGQDTPHDSDSSKTGEGGFCTAGGSKIKVSDEALRAARIRMKVNSTSSGLGQVNTNVSVGFSTARGMKITVSDKALEDSKRTMNRILGQDSIRDCDDVVGNGVYHGGFSTAAGSKIEVSDEALQSARTKMRMDDHSKSSALGKENSNVKVGFSTASGLKISVTDKALEESKRNMSRMLGQDTPHDSDSIKTGEGGFCTAGGAKIEVSEKALQSAKSKMKGLLKENMRPNSTTPMTGFATAGGSVIKVSEESLTVAKSKLSGFLKTEVSPLSLQKRTSSSLIQNRSVQIHNTNGFDDDWDDDADLANIAETSERNFLAVQANPFTCLPYQVDILEKGYSGGPELLQYGDEKHDQGPGDGFIAPYVKETKKRPTVDFDLSSMMGKNQKVDSIEGKEQFLSEEAFRLADNQSTIMAARDKCRKKQNDQIKRKLNTKIRAMPGRLWTLRSSQDRIPIKDINIVWTNTFRIRKSLTALTAVEWRFEGSKFFSSETAEYNANGIALGDGVVVVLSDDGDLGLEEFRTAFLCCPGVDPKLVPEGWLDNHYKWIVWGLDSLERRLGRQLLTPTSVMDRLKYRYDREVDRGERSILRKVLEKDESAGVPMVLCVSEVSSSRLVLTDCWYSIDCPVLPGTALYKMVEKGKVKEGMKLLTQGAELIGPQADVACPPLESAGRELKIYINSTRRVRWSQKLGIAMPFVVSLSSLVVGGGFTAMLKVMVARVYPLMYFVRENERSKFINEKDWEKGQKKGGNKNEEEVYSQVCKEVMEEENKRIQGIKKIIGEKELSAIECGEELLDIMTVSEDPVLQGLLTKEQVKALEEARMNREEDMRQKIAEKVKQRVGDVKSSHGTPVLKVRVVDCNDADGKCSGLVTVWRPGQFWLEMQEGLLLGLTGAQVNRVDGHTVHLTIGKQAQYEEIPLSSDNLKKEAYTRSLSCLANVCRAGYRPMFSELDLVVAVVEIGEGKPGKFQTLTVVDESMYCAKLLVWGGGCNLQQGQVVSIRNIEWRSNSGQSNVPSLYLTEYSVLSHNPRDKEHSVAVQRLQHRVKNTDFMVQSRQSVLRQISSKQSRHPNPSTTPTSLSSTPQRLSGGTRYPIPCNSPTISAWNSDNLSTRTGSKLAKLDAYTANLAKQGCRLPLTVAPLPPPPARVLTPYKPPQSSQTQIRSEREENVMTCSSQEMEEYAMEMMDQLDM